MNYLTFPFGKYKGFRISEIPINYVVYALQNMDLPEELNEQLRDVLIEQLDLSFADNVNVKSAYRNMCKKYHPDMGGSDYAMQIINEFYNLLK